MKNVLIISSTPRRGGNSDVLCDEFLRGVAQAGNKAEKICLREKKIHPCTGCGVCNITHVCVQKDDMEEQLEKMVEADVIVLATPVYFYTMCAQMKMLIDRTVSRYTELKNKDFYFIVTAADNNVDAMKRTIEGFRGFTEDCLPGAKEKGIIYGIGAWQVGEIQSTDAMQEAYKMGKNV